METIMENGRWVYFNLSAEELKLLVEKRGIFPVPTGQTLSEDDMNLLTEFLKKRYQLKENTVVMYNDKDEPAVDAYLPKQRYVNTVDYSIRKDSPYPEDGVETELLLQEGNNAMNKLSEAINELSRRLQWVSYNGPTEVDNETKASAGFATSEISDRILTLVNEVNYQADRVIDLIRNLRV